MFSNKFDEFKKEVINHIVKSAEERKFISCEELFGTTNYCVTAYVGDVISVCQLVGLSKLHAVLVEEGGEVHNVPYTDIVLDDLCDIADAI